MRYFLVILIISAISCKSQKKTNNENLGDDLILLEQDGYSAVDSFETMVVRDTKTLNAFYTKINRTRKPGLPVPMVDFSKEMVLIVCMGKQVGENLPGLIKKEESDDEITLLINLSNPSEKEQTDLISSPFCVYKMPFSDKEVLFLEQGLK